MKSERDKVENSLIKIGEYFPDIKKACIKGFYKIETQRLSDMDEILRCIKLYVILKDLKKLTGRKLEVLAYYLLYGYSKNTKKAVIKGIKITDSNLNNINHELRKMGVINSIGWNQSANEVNKDLLEFKNFVVDEKGSYLFIQVTE